MSETVCVWERERKSERERLLVWRVHLKMFRDKAALAALGYNSEARPVRMSKHTTIAMNSHYRKIWSSRVPEFPEPLIPGSEIPTHQQVSCSLSQLAIITPEALNSCCMFIFLLKLTLLALITKFRQPSVCQSQRQRPRPPRQTEIGAISMIAVCVLPPFYLIVLYGVPASIKDLRRLTILKKKKHIQQKCFGNTQNSEQNSSHRKGKMFQRVCSMT